MKHTHVEVTKAEDCQALADAIAVGFHNIPGYTIKQLKNEALIYLHDAWDTFKDSGRENAAFPGWASSVIRNRFVDLWRTQTGYYQKNSPLNAPDENGDEPLDWLADTRPDADVVHATRHAESIRVYYEALAQMPEEEQATLKAVQEGKSYAQVGEELGISKQAVSKRFWKAAQHLRKILGAKGYVDVTLSGVLTSNFPIGDG